MTLRELTMVGLRIVAIWIGVSALTVLPSLAYGIAELVTGGMSRFGGVRESWLMVGSPLLVGVLHAGIGVVLFVMAPRLARSVSRGSDPDFEPAKVKSIRPGDLYHIAAFLMGIYVLVRSISPGARAAVAMVDRTAGAAYAALLVEAVVFLAFGAALILGGRGIAAFFASLGHDPDNVPAQQFSMRVILAVVIGTAILLGIIRALVG